MWEKFGLVTNVFLNLIKLAKQRVPWKFRSPPPPPELPTSSELERVPWKYRSLSELPSSSELERVPWKCRSPPELLTSSELERVHRKYKSPPELPTSSELRRVPLKYRSPPELPTSSELELVPWKYRLPPPPAAELPTNSELEHVPWKYRSPPELPTSSELELVPWKYRSPPLSPEFPTSSELERSPVDVDTETQEQPIIDQQPRRATIDHIKMQWPLLVIGVCFAAVGVALQALQTPKPLPTIFHYFCMVLELSFVTLVLSIYIRRRHEVASVVMEEVSIFLGATAFMLAIGMNFPAPFMEITVAVCFIALLIIVFGSRSMP